MHRCLSNFTVPILVAHAFFNQTLVIHQECKTLEFMMNRSFKKMNLFILCLSHIKFVCFLQTWKINQILSLLSFFFPFLRRVDVHVGKKWQRLNIFKEF